MYHSLFDFSSSVLPFAPFYQKLSNQACLITDMPNAAVAYNAVLSCFGIHGVQCLRVIIIMFRSLKSNQ